MATDGARRTPTPPSLQSSQTPILSGSPAPIQHSEGVAAQHSIVLGSSSTALTVTALIDQIKSYEWIDTRSLCAVVLDSEHIFVGQDNGSITVWTWNGTVKDQEVKEASVSCILQSHSKFPVVALAPCRLPGRSGGSVACVQTDGTLSIISESSLSFEACQPRMVNSVGEIRGAAAFGEGRFLAVIGKSASVLVLDLVTFTPTHLLHGHEDWVSAIAARDESPSLSTLVTCSDDGMLHIWKWKSDNFASELKRTTVRFPASSPNPLEAGENQRQPKQEIDQNYSISFGGSTLLVVSPNGRCGVIENDRLDVGDTVVRLITTDVVHARFVDTQNGREAILVVKRDHSIVVYQRTIVKTGEYKYSVFEPLPTDSINSIASYFSNNLSSCNCEDCIQTLICPLSIRNGTGEMCCFMLRGSCSEEQLVGLNGIFGLCAGGRKGRSGSKANVPLSVLVAPSSPHFAEYPTTLARELSDGSIGVALLPNVPSHTVENDDAVTTKRRRMRSKITSLTCFSTWHWDNGASRIVLVGRENGRIELYQLVVPSLHSEILDAPQLVLIKEVQAHITAVTGFSSHPEGMESDQNEKMFCTIGADNDVVVFSLSRQLEGFQLVCLFRFSGHHSTVRSIYWDTFANAIHVKCDKTFVWSLLSGCLERRAGNSLDFSFQQASRHSTKTGAILFAHTPTSLVAGTFEGETDPLSRTSRARRLDVVDEGDGSSMAARSIEFPVSMPLPCGRFASALDMDTSELGETMRQCFEHGRSDRCGLAYGAALSLLHEWGIDPDLDEICRTRLGMRPPSSELRIRYCYKQRFPSGAVTMSIGTKRWATSELLTANLNLGMVALFLTATTFQSVPIHISETLSQLVAAYGIKFPDVFRQRNEWKEPALILLARQALTHERWDELSSGIHVAARLLLQRTLERMPVAQRTALVSEWSVRLSRLRESFQTQIIQQSNMAALGHGSTGANLAGGGGGAGRGGHSQASLLAASQLKGGGHLNPASLTPQGLKRISTTELSSLESESFVVEEETPMDDRLRTLIMSSREYQLLILLLAVVGVVHPEDLSPASARLVTETLVELVSVRESPRQSPSGASSVGSGLSSQSISSSSNTTLLGAPASFFQRHLSNRAQGGGNATTTMTSSTTVPLSGPTSSADAICINAAFAAELLAKGFPLFRPHIPHMSRFIRKLLMLATDDLPQGSTAADRAMSEVGSAHPVLFVRTIGAEACKKEVSDTYRRKALEVLVSLVKSFPLIFLRHLPLVAEVVIKTLDPSEPVLRNSCLTASTMALQELVKRYPMVSFHQNSQRFAVGTVESTIIIYDLRTATKWRVLDGTEGAVSAVAFEKEGERMASYCAYEHAVRIWATRSPGLFGGLLTIRGTFLSSIQLPALPEAPNEQAILKECRLEWTGPMELRLRREMGGQPHVLKIPHV